MSLMLSLTCFHSLKKKKKSNKTDLSKKKKMAHGHTTPQPFSAAFGFAPSTLCLSALRGWRREWRRRTRQAGATWRGGAHIQALHLAQPRPQRARARGQLDHLDHALAPVEARREVLAPAAVEEEAARPRLAYHNEAAVDRARLRRAAPPATARADGRRLARGKVGARVRVRVGLGLG